MGTTQQAEIDVLVLGTSPILLIEALVLARTGRQVVLVDAGASIGGAWQSIRFGDLEDVEGACHVFETYRGFERFLHRDLGLPMAAMEPPPLVVGRDGKVRRYDALGPQLRRLGNLLWRLPVAALGRGVEALSGGRVRFPRLARFRIGHSLDLLRRYLSQPWLGAQRRRQVYPVGGAPGMLRWFRTELQRHGARFERAVVESVAVGTGQSPQVVATDGRSWRARELVLGESLGCDRLVVDGREHRCAAVVESYPHLVMSLCGTEQSVGSYVHLLEDPFLLRLADVTDACRWDQGRPQGSRVVLCELLRNEAAASVTPGQLLEHLQQRGLLPRGVVLQRYAHVRFQNRRSVGAFGHLLPEAAVCSARLLRSRGDLAWGILRQAPRWRRLLRAAPTRPPAGERPVVLPAAPAAPVRAAAASQPFG